jgi:phospholipid transport system substrate-binding protein
MEKVRRTGIGRRPAAGLGALFAVLYLAVAAFAATPTGEIRGAIDRVIQIVKNPNLAGAGHMRERRDLLRKEILPVFDFEEMAKRSLGPDWRARTPEERKDFIAVFSGMLENSYLGKIEGYKGEKIRYDRESIDGEHAVVPTVITSPGGEEFTVEYRVLKENGRWRVNDIVIEGISLVNNYRSQFAGMLQKMPFADMMKKLRAAAGTKAAESR